MKNNYQKSIENQIRIIGNSFADDDNYKKTKKMFDDLKKLGLIKEPKFDLPVINDFYYTIRKDGNF